MRIENEEYWMFFTGMDYFGAEEADRLIGHFGSIKEVFCADDSELMLSGLLCPSELEWIVTTRRGYDAEAEYERVIKAGIEYVSRENPLYPERLRQIPDGPLGLFYKGNLPENGRPAVAVIGSRACTGYGREIAVRFSEELSRLGIDIISGMAAGIDGHSHRGALAGGGRTYGILGNGVDICYPPANRDIYAEIPEHGGLISEYPPGRQSLPANFPRRNRIISGLADGILVVEARQRSGTGITVEMGLEQGKDIYAIPGRIGDKLSDGCNKLIRQGARLVTSPEDIVAEMAHSYGYLVDREGAEKCAERKKKIKGLTSDQAMVLKLLDLQPKSTSELSFRTGLDFSQIMSVLTMLELRGLARSTGDGRFTSGGGNGGK
ncbi:MAG: DNA-processing protein DprA [Lachnospiraceae bacterium]|nr:DNA-processing protein DprA [Lachnospiraceae bacterium]